MRCAGCVAREVRGEVFTEVCFGDLTKGGELENVIVKQNSTYPEHGYPDRLGPSGKFVENSTKFTCPEITGYRIKYIRALWFLELKIWVWSKGPDAGTYCK
jgi:hypothetical protein